MTWVLRAILLGALPSLVYTQIWHSQKGILVGLAAAVVIIGVEAMLERVKLMEMIVGLLGAFLGILVAKLLDYAVTQTENVALIKQWDLWTPVVQAGLAYLGMMVMIHKFPEVGDLDKDIMAASKRRGSEFKVLDSSAIIDGRIMDICQTKFLSGTLIVPRFVLQELHMLADSPDNIKRARGRRGLDILARLQEDKLFPVRVLDKDIPELKDVDSKVVRLAREMNAAVVTTDFNLNKLCALENVTVLNVNDLTTALKPVVLPGEQMNLFVMREGKERDQGVGYLDDGTMVVIEDGKKLIGKKADVSVVSILQTSAGRMIFAKSRGQSSDNGKEKEPRS